MVAKHMKDYKKGLSENDNTPYLIYGLIRVAV